MITDAEFWIETRRRNGGGDALFRSMLSLIHARQANLDARTTTLDREQFQLLSLGRERCDAVEGKVLSAEEKKRVEEWKRRKEKELKDIDKANSVSVEANKAIPSPNTPPRRVATITLRVLQQVMMFAVPIYALRYNVPAMSMSWNTSCFIDRPTKQLITFGAGQGVKVPQHLCGRGCVAGDGFFAILTDQDEVWASGGLKVASASSHGPTALGREDVMTGIAVKSLMLVGHGQRLASVTRAFTVRPLSAIANPTRSIIPSRHVRFVDLGYGEDYYMIGTDSVVYKTTASKRAVSTPRRVMTLCRTPVSRVASGTSFLLIIDQNGHLYTFGRNKKGQLGNGEIQDARRKPFFHEQLTHHYFVQVAAGDCHSLALSSDGTVYGAGSNESGQLGFGAAVKQEAAFKPIPLPCKCIGIAAGPAGSMFALEDGQVMSCGLNDCMQLGLDTSQKIVYEPTHIAIFQAGVESYTMDFGGYRRPEPSEENSDADGDDGAPGMISPAHGAQPASNAAGSPSQTAGSPAGQRDPSQKELPTVLSTQRDDGETPLPGMMRNNTADGMQSTSGGHHALEPEQSWNASTSLNRNATFVSIVEPERHSPDASLSSDGGDTAPTTSGAAAAAAQEGKKPAGKAAKEVDAKKAKADEKAKCGCCAVM